MLIIYDNQKDNCVGMLMPTAECPLPIEAIARKDVPAGASYRIVPDDFFGDVPRDEWTADFSSPDGVGDSRYGAGTDWDVIGYSTNKDGILKLNIRNSDGLEKSIPA